MWQETPQMFKKSVGLKRPGANLCKFKSFVIPCFTEIIF